METQIEEKHMTIESFVEKKTEKEKEETETAQREELTRTLQRVQADFDNYRKRMQGENHSHFLRGKAAALKDLLAFADTLDAAIENEKEKEGAKKEFESLKRAFQQILEQNRVKPMQVVGKTFDPFTSECLMQGNDSSKEEDLVLEEIQKGYYFHDDVLRTAKVKVNKKEKKENDAPSSTEKGGNQNE